MLQRRSFVTRSSGLLGVFAAGMAPAVVHPQTQLRWRLASSFPKTLDVAWSTLEAFAARVAEATGGKFQISLHAAGELVPALGAVDAVQNAAVEIAYTAPLFFVGKNETFALGCAIPFGLNSRQMTAWMVDGNGLKLMREFYAKYGIVNFPGGNTGAQMGGWFRKEINSLADLKGLKFRVGGFGGKVLEPLGVVPQNLPPTDIFPALEKGVVDAAEWVGPYDDLKLGFYKVAPHYYYPGFWEGCTQVDFFVNAKAWETLPADHKAVFELAAAQAHIDMQAKYDARNPAALRQLVAAGAKLHAFPAEVLEAAYRAAEQLYSDLAARNPDWRRVWADYAKFRADQLTWFRFAEAGFDRFMLAQRL